MLEDTEDREQFIGGLVFVAAFLVIWLLGRLVYDDAYAVVLAGILATAATVVYYSYVQYVRHRQEVAEWVDEHRYRFDRLAEALHRVAEQTGANRLVGRIDARLEATVGLLRDRLEDAEAVEYPEIVIGALRFLVTGERPPEPAGGTGSTGDPDGAGRGSAVDAGSGSREERGGDG